MVHHAYIRWTGNLAGWRYQITFPNVETCDEWWRTVEGGKLGIKRFSSDFYTYDSGNWWDETNKFANVMLFTVLNDRGGRNVPFLYNPPRSDPVSGNSFYIRSKSNPNVYWYVTAEGQGRIYASTLGRTRFRIHIDGEKDGEAKIMIGSDKIAITKASDPKYIVGLNSGELYLSEQTNYFSYKDLKNRFLAQGETAPGGEARNTAVVRQLQAGSGEEWELVA